MNTGICVFAGYFLSERSDLFRSWPISLKAAAPQTQTSDT